MIERQDVLESSSLTAAQRIAHLETDCKKTNGLRASSLPPR
jgi:hypothetical protein